MQIIECVKDYQMCGGKIKKGTILTEKENSEIGSTTYTDEKLINYTFDNSEILFSHEFHSSFKLVGEV